MVLGKQILALACCLSLWPTTTMAQSDTQVSFSDYVAALKQEAMDKGFGQQTIDAVFPKIKMFKKAQAANNNPAEVPITLETYLPQVVPQSKVDLARAFYKQHDAELEIIGKRYGVQPRFIVALLGIESNFGQSPANYPVLSVTASLAYEGHREAYFRKEFFAALKIVEQGESSFAQLKSNSMGAMGKPLFLPSAYLTYAQDGDGDGKKDIWGNSSDALASVAYYLQQSGWKASETWGRQVWVPKQFEPTVASLSIKKSFNEWQAMGVRRFDGSDLPKREDMQISMVMPDGISGRKYLVYDNYRGLLQWNASDYFAISVTYLSERIKYPPII
ncbi:lytic murein transglycosylase [Shewanella schlegeliana]|uniref:Lytic murein transglycosylase n=1 Tax=Shewanella schlegeliana TaxID=190308 RepID=A0ABS1STS8_9GAMM|nr:lytic murein transglycosylase [Shewanella schlegeliana]MBL4911943.1 lytic murein transglycosylase [Shewanella schlegeliana]MCL1110104.1 lytic murein transglycosylase [Shewanella schlegeliana]GIU26770.1 lytic transglycosylase [Shewanella schlegeliana]